MAGELHPDFLTHAFVCEGRIETVTERVKRQTIELAAAHTLDVLRVNSSAFDNAVEAFAEAVFAARSSRGEFGAEKALCSQLAHQFQMVVKQSVYGYHNLGAGFLLDVGNDAFTRID